MLDPLVSGPYVQDRGMFDPVILEFILLGTRELDPRCWNLGVRSWNTSSFVLGLRLLDSVVLDSGVLELRALDHRI